MVSRYIIDYNRNGIQIFIVLLLWKILLIGDVVCEIFYNIQIETVKLLSFLKSQIVNFFLEFQWIEIDCEKHLMFVFN